MARITVIGTTSWGMTLGVILANKGQQVKIWTRTEQEATKLKEEGPNPVLPQEVTLPAKLSFTSSLDEALSGARAVIMAVPSQTMRQNIGLVSSHLKETTLIVSAAKGLEIESGKRMTEVIAEEINPAFQSNICVLSGPNLSREILLNMPAATVVAAEEQTVSRAAQRLLTTPNLCVYLNTDIIGVELGGALKNIVALAAGIADGLGYGDNAKASLITRGLAEITAIGVSLGANPLTMAGLAGLGDLITTCASSLSRNHYVGVELTKGRKLEEITSTMEGVAEGVSTTLATWKLAQQLGVEMPITEKMYQVLYQGVEPRQAAVELMRAQVAHELSGRRWNLFSFFRRSKSDSSK